MDVNTWHEEMTARAVPSSAVKPWGWGWGYDMRDGAAVCHNAQYGWVRCHRGKAWQQDRSIFLIDQRRQRLNREARARFLRQTTSLFTNGG